MAFGLCSKFQNSSFKRAILLLFSRSNIRNIPAQVWRRYSSVVKDDSSVCKVLYLNSSGSDNRSYTGQTAREFLAKYTQIYPEHLIEEINLWDENLLSFGLSHVESKMRIASGQNLPEDKLKLLVVKEMTSQLLAANKVIISCPMWNYSIPYVLKQYIDCVVQSDLTFYDTANGPEGLVTGRPLLLITSSSSDFSNEPMKSLDFQVPYLKAIFGFIGFRDFYHIYIGNTRHFRREELISFARKRIQEEVHKF
ncbi:uncharacterized protein LOC114519241 [Dendronephthya gigantea]|uniref:uncharacterized protein LOC114519241 n=1 Tax=Dendronephthya gigantea TaxID=151771 RepID=UPI0010699833|nr:uncharacterized protein LOC114519241 [Dendronephthya gigantea]